MPHKPPLTHFLALPLYNLGSSQALSASIAQFAKDTTQVISDSSHGLESVPQAGQLPPGSIRPPSTLHLTLGVMSLTKPEQIEAAVSILQTLDIRDLLTEQASARSSEPDLQTKDIQDNVQSTRLLRASVQGAAKPLTVRLKGLHTFHSANTASVLFAKPHDSSGRLAPLCEELRRQFIHWGLIALEERELILHATIVNTVYAEKKGPGRGGRKQTPTIDARELVEQFKDHVWADVTIGSVVIYKMGAQEDEEGLLRYQEIATVPLS